LAIVSLWLGFNHSSTPELSQENEVIKTSDYAMTDFTLTVMDLEGNPSRIITGSEMAHYPKDDSTEIINPVAQFLEQEKDTWIVSSNKATTVDKGQDIVLTGNVIATQADNPDIELRTELLNLDTVHNTAYTNLPVTMKSPHGETDSVGLHASLDQQTINLHSRVKGHYDAPPIQ
jgi:lipopolysaccharide export system protein LptC